MYTELCSIMFCKIYTEVSASLNYMHRETKQISSPYIFEEMTLKVTELLQNYA